MAGRTGGRHSLRKADVRQFLLAAPLSLEPGDIAELEAQVGEGHRIDVEVGATVIEVKRDLRRGRVREEARKQLAGYVARRQGVTGARYVDILTDGAEWLCHHLVDGQLVEVSALELNARGVDLARLLW